MSSSDAETSRDEPTGLPKTRPLVRPAHDPTAPIILRGSHSLSLQPFAALAAHCVGCELAWIDLGTSRYASHMGSLDPKSPYNDVTLNDLKRSLFRNGPPAEFTIIPEADIFCAAGDSNQALRLFVIASPVKLGSAKTGLLMAASLKVKKLTAEQIEAFRSLAASLEQLQAERLSVVAPLPPERAQTPAAAHSPLLDQCDAPAWLIDSITNRLVAVNDQALDLLGYDRQTFLGFKRLDAISIVRQTIQDSSHEHEVRLKCSDGTLAILRVLTLETDHNGKPAKLEIGIDLTESRQLEERCELQSAALSQVSDAVIALDTNLRIISWNKPAETVYGWSAAEVLGEKLQDIVRPRWNTPTDERRATTAMLAEGFWQGDVAHHHRNGAVIKVRMVTSAIKTGRDGRVVGYSCVIQNVTEKLEIETSLAVSQMRYQSLFYSNPDAVIWLDLGGKITASNKAADVTFGISSNVGYTPDLASLCTPSDLATLLSSFDRAKRGDTVQLEFTGLNGAGWNVSVSAILLPVTVNDKIDGVYLVAKDITEQKWRDAVALGENAVLQNLLSRGSLESVIDALVSRFDECLGGDRCSVLLIGENATDSDDKIHGVEYTRGGFPQTVVLYPGSSAQQAIVTMARALHIDPNAENSPYGRRSAPKATCSVPILDAQGICVGAFTIKLMQARTPSLEEIRTAERAAFILGIAIESNRSMVSLHANEERFRQLVEHASDIILVIEESGAIRYASPAMSRVMGYSPGEVLGVTLIEYIHPEDVPHARVVFSRVAETPGLVRSFELRAQRYDGTWCYLEATVQNLLDAGGIGGIVVTARDLSERMLASDQLDHLAFHDSLTDLPNRMLFNDRLGRALLDARRNETMVAVMFLDVNRFKVINDSLGHTVGDGLLKEVAARLVATARDGDTVARWGGDEFTLVFTNVTSSRDAARVAQRIINSIGEPFEITGSELFTTVSIGISMFPSAGEDVETLVRNADTAMYRAKDEAQSSYQFYSQKMNAGAGERLALESSLRRAVERREFELFYQPQIDAKTGAIVSAEALVRWRHPEQGLVPPKDFIPLAEETGLIVPMGEWILRAACEQSRTWHDAGHGGFRIAVNLSARQFVQRDLHQTVLRILRDSKADPTGLELELTESVLIHGEERVVATMNDLASLGVTVSIDDFGIGYASYAYLKRFPVKALKIDQSFVKGMLTDSHDNAIVQSIISMAHTIGIKVIAEGVETVKQRDALLSLDCDVLQGYFYSKPVPADEFTKLLDTQSVRLAS